MENILIVFCGLIAIIGLTYFAFKQNLPISSRIGLFFSIILTIMLFILISIEFHPTNNKQPKPITYDYKLNIVNDSVWLYQNDKLVQSGKYDSLLVLIERDNL